MRDYTTNGYCDFLWISDLLELKRESGKNEFILEVQKDQKSIKCSVLNIIIFGTIVEVKELGYNGVLYQIDDGTGVIACKRNANQFEQVLSVIEQEQVDIVNQTDVQHLFDQSSVGDSSTDDSIFNDRSIQIEDANFNKKIRLRNLQSIWDDIYKSFSSLVQPYNIGDSVVIQGKLYTYFNMNQIYINSIRLMDVAEEIMLLTLKLENGKHLIKNETSKSQPRGEKRQSGIVTFDNIPHPNPKIRIPTIVMPEWDDALNNSTGIVTPNLNPTITFDTFTSPP